MVLRRFSIFVRPWISVKSSVDLSERDSVLKREHFGRNLIKFSFFSDLISAERMLDGVLYLENLELKLFMETKRFFRRIPSFFKTLI